LDLYGAVLHSLNVIPQTNSNIWFDNWVCRYWMVMTTWQKVKSLTYPYRSQREDSMVYHILEYRWCFLASRVDFGAKKGLPILCCVRNRCYLFHCLSG
jgi:hypothetical protein